jgi:hypothetical protein
MEDSMAANFAVIGAGHGGKAMAAHLALMGFKVSLYNRTMSHIEVIKTRGGIELDGGRARRTGSANWRWSHTILGSDQGCGSHHGRPALVGTCRGRRHHGASSFGWTDHPAASWPHLRRIGVLEWSSAITKG